MDVQPSVVVPTRLPYPAVFVPAARSRSPRCIAWLPFVYRWLDLALSFAADVAAARPPLPIRSPVGHRTEGRHYCSGSDR
ncbi:hypothetical protein GN956_G10190 [Arapaima gigas]